MCLSYLLLGQVNDGTDVNTPRKRSNMTRPSEPIMSMMTMNITFTTCIILLSISAVLFDMPENSEKMLMVSFSIANSNIMLYSNKL